MSNLSLRYENRPREIQKVSLTFSFLTENLSKKKFYILDFQAPIEVSIKGITRGYAEFLN